MQNYKDANGQVHVLDSTDFEHLLPAGCVRITQDEADAIRQPAPPTLTEIKARLSAAVDSEISAIYSKFTRFTSEYQEREAAARSFKAAGYSGDAGPWVMSFATPAGKTAQQATDIIIGQADALQAVLIVLGGLRMRKYEIASAADAVAAQAIHDDIMLKARQAAAGL